MNELENLRNKIDEIDKEMIGLFEKRMNTVRDIAEYKIKNNLPILNQGREDIVIAKVKENLNNKDYNEGAVAFIKELMAISRKEQEKIISNKK